MKTFRLLLAGVAVAFLLSGCGGGSDTDGETRQFEGFAKLELTLEGDASPETVGPLTADSLGQFFDAGIEVGMGTPLNAERPIGYVVGDLADVVVSYQPQVVLAVEEGQPVVAFGSLVPETTMAMIWLERSGIDDVADLKGKTIATPGASFQSAFLEAILAQNGLSPDEVEVVVGGSRLATLLEEGKVDAIFGGSENVEGVALEELGSDPVVTPVTELGIPDYDELVFVTRRDRWERNTPLYRAFVEAATAGTEAAKENPAAGTKAIVDQYFGPNPPGLRAGVDATLPLLSEDGEIDPERTADLIAWMHREGLIQRELPVSAVLAEE